MKYFFISIVAVYLVGAAPDPNYIEFPKYLKKMSDCKSCIDAIGKREFA